ncbi:DEAD/DEAH box helicase [archaeon]|nr:DEAD/DEAH box helicase [archaeon]
MYEIKGFEPRLYQQTIFNTCIKSNTLVVLPTGKGKTKLSILVAVHRLNNFPKSKILFLTPTKPLASQICQEFKECTNIENINLFTGEIKPELRKELWRESDVVISTPQTITNDIINKNVNFSEISLLVFDESHLATGDYDYVWLAKQYQQKSEFPRIVGLTASPGDNLESISEICKKLFIEDIEVRSLDDKDIKPYVFETKTEYLLVELSEDLKEVKKYLDDCLKERLDKLKNFGLVKNIKYVSKTSLLGMQRELQQRIARGDRDILLWSSISLVAECLKAHHALEMLETQGVSSLSEYMNKIYTESKNTKVKSTKNLVIDTNFKSAYAKTNILIEKGIEHPKLLKLKEIIAEEVKSCEKILVFNHYRDSASKLKKELNKIEGVKAELFVGQAKKKDTGLTQKKQIEMLENFKAGKFNVVIMTSVGELGLDIPAVDLIVFYEPVPSAIRQIQRRGRTSRHKEGKLKVLVTKGTRDEAYRWSAHHKEKRMYTVLKDLKSKLSLGVKQEKLSSFDSKLKIYADSRERGSAVIRNLVEKGVDVKVQNLEVGDFLVSERVGIERKEVRDFVDSLIDKRILHQLKMLKDNFEKPVLIIEGVEDIYSVRKVHANAIRGMLAYIAVGLGIPIVNTKDFRDTVDFLVAVAKREQEDSKKEFGIRGERKPLTLKEQQEFVVSGFPGVGPTLAKGLLSEFGSVKSVIGASEAELTDVEKIGKKKAKEIRKVLDEEYKK